MHGHEPSCSYGGFFQGSRHQLSTAAGYRITGTAKVLIAVTLFLLESLLLRTRLTWFLYSE